jgi:putative ABC transport system substrate-binding protein
MYKRSAMAIVLGLGILATAPAARGQMPPAPKRTGVLGYSNPVAGKAFLDVFADELTKLGWIEGRNLVTTYRYAQGDPTRMDTLAAELVALKPDVIYTTSGSGALALQRATRAIPVVISGTTDPVALGLVRSLTHPHGQGAWPDRTQAAAATHRSRDRIGCCRMNTANARANTR